MTCSGAVQDEDLLSKRHLRDPIGPRVSLVQPRTSQSSASWLLRRDYLPAALPVEAHQQNPLGWHPTVRENPSLPLAKRAALPAH